MLYGYSHTQEGPWVGIKIGSDQYFGSPGDALEAGRANYYHAGQNPSEKPPVFVAKLEKVKVSDFLIEGLQFFLAEMAEKAVIEFDAGGDPLSDWLQMYSPGEAYAPDADPETNASVAFTRLFDLNFGRMLDFQSDGAHWVVNPLTRVMKGDQGGWLKLEVQHDQQPKWQW